MDKLYLSTIGIAMVSNNQEILDKTINKIYDFIYNLKNVSIVESTKNYYVDEG